MQMSIFFYDDFPEKISVLSVRTWLSMLQYTGIVTSFPANLPTLVFIHVAADLKLSGGPIPTF